MKILLVHNNGSHRIGGVETWMIALAGVYRSLGHVCDIFWLGKEGLEGEQEANGVIRRGSLAECIELILARGCDVVHASTSDWDAGMAVVHRLPEAPRLVLTNHGEIYPMWNSWNCDAIAGCSRWTAQDQQRWTDLPVYLVFNGIDLTRFSAPERIDGGPPIVAWVGRGDDMIQKRIDKLAAVAPMLRSRGLRIWIADPRGPEKVPAEVARVVRPLAERWSGVAVEEMPEFLRAVAASGGCVLSTSAFEGLPLALVEAQACGCPVIGPDVRGVNECVEAAGGGVLYPFDTKAEELAAIISQTVGDEEGMRWRREACGEFVRQRFSLPRMAEEYLRIYQAKTQGIRSGVSALRMRLRAAWPIRYRPYVRRRWAAAHSQYQCFTEFMHKGERRWAKLVASTSVRTCATIYLRPARLKSLVKAMVGVSAPALPVIRH
ncbi:MAG TPA: glycosyltransferase family 4 protein [Tepidisphaeraceae bacterium]|nr:glycosyltransferase family 4 protein [Tepidisphaeraceae bacterium]